MNINYMCRQLRTGRTPESMGLKKIGEGMSKAAYLHVSSTGVKKIVKLLVTTGDKG